MEQPMSHVVHSLKSLAFFTITSILAFISGIGLGLGIVFMNKYIQLEYISNNFLLILWSLYWGLSAYSLLFKSENSQYKFRLKMSVYTLFYGSGVYIVLLKGEGVTSANLFASTAILGLLMVITAPPVIEKCFSINYTLLLLHKKQSPYF